MNGEIMACDKYLMQIYKKSGERNIPGHIAANRGHHTRSGVCYLAVTLLNVASLENALLAVSASGNVMVTGV